MKPRPLLSLLAVFIVLLVIAYLQIRPAPSVTDSEFITSLPFLGKDLNYGVSDIVAVRLRDPNSNQSLVLSRDASGSWEDSVNQRVLDQTEASNILKSVVLLIYSNTVPITEATRLEDFGFDPDGLLVIEFALANGQGHGIAVGNRNPTDDGYYALVDNLPRIYILDRGVVEYLHSQMTNPAVFAPSS